MPIVLPRRASVLGCVAGFALLGNLHSAEPTERPASDAILPAIDEARARAVLLHEAVHAMLHVVHRDFYREDEGLPIPAASMAKVFRRLEEQQGVTLRWLAVEGEAMNVDHKPRDAFERAAAKQIQEGDQPHEEVERGIYRRAAAITLSSECLKCHVPDRKSTEDRSAGLVISMPVRGERK